MRPAAQVDSGGHRSSSAATWAPSRTVASPKGVVALPRASSSRTCFRPAVVELGHPVGERRQPAEGPDRVGPPVPLGVRRAGDQAVGVVDPEPPLLPGARRQRHQPAQAVGAVLATLVEGVGGDAHRVHQADARQQRRPAADQVDLGADHLADQRQAGAVGLLAGHVLGAATAREPARRA